MKKFDMIMLGILIAGGINWGLWGFFGFNLVEYIIGNIIIDRIVYVLFGIGAIYQVVRWSWFFGRAHKN